VRVIGPGPDAPGEPYYEIVAGERRWQAARLAGIPTVPVIVRELSDQAALAVALIENLQREDLNAIDQARSMSRLAEEFELTHDEIAKALGRSRASVTNFVRLLDLDDEVKDAIVNGTIDMGHARAMLPLDPKRQVSLSRKVQRHGWSVRQVEKAVQTLLAAPADSTPAAADFQTRWLQNQLSRELGENISLRPDTRGGYVLKIEFANLAKLESTLQRLTELIGRIRETAGPRVRDSAG
jgi:ParB family chromosome partitioning protein